MRELLQLQEASGLSLKAFATREGVPHTTLSWWRSRLRRSGEAAFVPVHVRESSPMTVEIAVGDVVVRVVDGDEQTVARLVRALLSC
jgi:hypothetical protein